MGSQEPLQTLVLLCRPSRKCIATTLVIGIIAARAEAADVVFGPNDVQSAVIVAKSDDRNQVHYLLRLDAQCQLAGKEPIVPYWHIIEPSFKLKYLSWLDKFGYGIKWQKTTSPTTAQMGLRGYGRQIDIVTSKSDDGKCAAKAYTTIAGARAELTLIYLRLAGPMSVEYMELRGHKPGTDEKVIERVKP